ADHLVVDEDSRRARDATLRSSIGVLRYPPGELARAHAACEGGIGDPARPAEALEPRVREESRVLRTRLLVVELVVIVDELVGVGRAHSCGRRPQGFRAFLVEVLEPDELELHLSLLDELLERRLPELVQLGTDQALGR